MSTVADLVAETRAMIYSTAQIEQNLLGTTVNDTTDTIQVSYELRGITPGAKIAIDEEVMYVWGINSGTNVATVQRGFLNTTAVAHTAGAVVDVNPPFPTYAIKQELRKEIRSWPTEVFGVSTVEVTASGTARVQGIDLGITGDWWHILDIRHSPDSGRVYSNTVWSSVTQYDIQRNAPVASFASGAAIILNEPVPSGTVTITYSHPFDTSTWDDATDLLTDVGMTASMLDIPVMGAAWRLSAFREVKRSLDEAQGESRFAQEVPPGTASQGADYFRAIRNRRLGEESARLIALHPRRNT